MARLYDYWTEHKPKNMCQIFNEFSGYAVKNFKMHFTFLLIIYMKSFMAVNQCKYLSKAIKCLKDLIPDIFYYIKMHNYKIMNHVKCLPAKHIIIIIMTGR